ncbi:MAG: M20/M25/M40 family metallo-hydrolase [Planctomycetes bacterium]|nr:M20/M25/M40 family metallo-hydrolase [Planctomycetota bacterium]
MQISPVDIRKAIGGRVEDARRLLVELVATVSLPGAESSAMDVAAEAFGSVAEVESVDLHNRLRDDEHYSDVIADLDYEGRRNLRVVLPGAGSAEALLLNTHIDTVPPSLSQQRGSDEMPVSPGKVVGRGACDAKGQVATVFLAMAALKDLGVRPRGDLIAHIVVEEEAGGNGTLAMVRRGESAGGCIVLEPTELRILTAIRGAVWFRVSLRGRSGHSGRAGATRSALGMAVRVIEILQGYHDRLLSESRGEKMFAGYPDPMPLTVGKLHAGVWPAAVAGEAQLEGVLGLLPNKSASEVMDEVASVISREGGSEIADNCDIHFTYRHDASVCSPDEPIVGRLSAALAAAGRPAEIGAMTASCDACYYNNLLSIPTVVFGGGSLSVAHSDDEYMPLDELVTAGETLVHLACGLGGSEGL